MDTPWHSILELARHAPSPHNAQPWRVRVVDESQAEVYIECARTLPEEELTGSSLVLTMGLFVESMRLVAALQGYTLEDELAAANDSYEAKALDARNNEHLLFARLRLSASSLPPLFPAELFLARRTSRLPFDPGPVGLEEARALTEIATSWGYRYTQSSDARRIEHLLDASRRASRRRLALPGCREEVGRWIRFSDRDARTRGDGLDARCLNRQPFGLFAEYRLPDVFRVLRGRDDSSHGAATIGCLAGPFGSCKESYRAGQFLMDFWLECARLGLSIQPFSPLVTDREVARRGELDWRVPGIWFAFRIGRSAEAPKSYRRAVFDLLIGEDELRAGAPPTSRGSSGRRS